VKDHFANSPAISAGFNRWFGEKHSKTLMHATAGSIIGVGEVRCCVQCIHRYAVREDVFVDCCGL
jgi:hypothetical protein